MCARDPLVLHQNWNRNKQTSERFRYIPYQRNALAAPKSRRRRYLWILRHPRRTLPTPRCCRPGRWSVPTCCGDWRPQNKKQFMFIHIYIFVFFPGRDEVWKDPNARPGMLRKGVRVRVCITCRWLWQREPVWAGRRRLGCAGPACRPAGASPPLFFVVREAAQAAEASRNRVHWSCWQNFAVRHKLIRCNILYCSYQGKFVAACINGFNNKKKKNLIVTAKKWSLVLIILAFSCCPAENRLFNCLVLQPHGLVDRVQRSSLWFIDPTRESRQLNHPPDTRP